MSAADLDKLAKAARAAFHGTALIQETVAPWERLTASSKDVWFKVVDSVLREIDRLPNPLVETMRPD